MHDTYALLDSGNGRKLEQVGKILLDRPCGVAYWNPVLEKNFWEKADAVFTREEKGQWMFRKNFSKEGKLLIENVWINLFLTDFGHLGFFPEHACLWRKIRENIQKSKKKDFSFLNLFAYTGGATCIAAKEGASVCHVDASKPMVQCARDNATLNGLEKAPIRWIVDDVFKFLKREIKREKKYDGILLDPPSFGRGFHNEVFKIEKDILPLLELCKELLSENPSFFIFSCHTPGFTPLVMDHLLTQYFRDKKGAIEKGEMILPSEKSFSVPSGSFALWESV